MRRTLLSRFALLSALAFVLAICITLVVNSLNSHEIVDGYFSLASSADEEAQELFAETTYDELFLEDAGTAYALMRAEIRNICRIYTAQHVYIYELDDARRLRTFLFCVASDDDKDELLVEERSLGSESHEAFFVQELAAASGSVDLTAYWTDNKYGNNLCWYFPFEIEGATKPVVFGIDFDAKEEALMFWYHTLSLTIPILVGIACVMIFELFLLKKSVSDPLRVLAGRMRSFTQDGVHNKEHIAVGKTAEIAEIESSFNKMTDDIDKYVHRIAQMREERVAAETELEVARRIQEGLVPPTTQCSYEGFEAYAFERTARAVGGDFYDLGVLDDGKLLLVIADVSGKGVSAALFMAMFLTLLHDKLHSCLDPAQSLNEANNTLLQNNPECMFVTLIAGIYDPTTRVLTYANAGHTPPLMVDGTYLSPDPGMALGFIENVGIENETLELKPGEGILFYTDGTTEAVNPQDVFFGEERLQQAVAGRRDAQGTVHAVVEAVDRFAGKREQFDDLTLLALYARQ